MKRPLGSFLIMLVLSLTTVASGEAVGQHRFFDSNEVEMDAYQGALEERGVRELLHNQELQRLQDQNEAAVSRNAFASDPDLVSPEMRTLIPGASLDDIRREADYILASQHWNPGDPAHGAINNVYGAPTWVVPRENALAILALLQAYQDTRNKEYRKRALAAADYLVRIQDSDGAWYDQYEYDKPVVLSKSPTQTAEVMMALDKVGYSYSRYQAMKKGAAYLMSLQDVANKGGLDDGLISGGKKADGTFHTWRWTSDNSFAYLALKSAQEWANRSGDFLFAVKAAVSARRILRGINQSLYIDDPNDPDFGVWRRVIDENGVAVDPTYHEWINYAPQMLDLPARGVGQAVVGDWIHDHLQKPDGAVTWDDRYFSERRSPGYTFQAILVWQDLGQQSYVDAALNWAQGSGLRQTAPDANGVSGSWIDWVDGPVTAQWWERFIDTSFYWVSVMRGGYNFR